MMTNRRACAPRRWVNGAKGSCTGSLPRSTARTFVNDWRQSLSRTSFVTCCRSRVLKRTTTTDIEGEEHAWAELVEYLRVAAQLAYEEFADFRNPEEDTMPDESDTLH